MNITFDGTYNALSAFKWEDVPTFAVITGRNGVGKSQLLQLIENAYNRDNSLIPFADIDNLQIGIDRALRIDNWNISDPQVIGDSEKEQMVQQFLSEYSNYSRSIQSFTGRRARLFAELQGRGVSYDISLHEFSKLIPKDFYMDEGNLLSYRLGFVFRDYSQKFAEISMRIVREDLEKSTEVQNFIDLHGEAPWYIFNDMMSAAGLEFKVVEPPSLDKSQIYLYDSLDRQISWGQVSSGEKTLIQLACWLLYKKVSADAFPKILLLDEPDASLHPAMVENLLAVVNDSIVRGLGVRVIMTTHSPTSIALAPKDSVYELTKSPTHIKPISQEEAIEILSDGLVLVAENTKYVFLEGVGDPFFYNNQYKSAFTKHGLSPKPSLAFTPVSIVEPGGVEQVKELIRTIDRLNAVGLTDKVKAIIDKDKGNEGSSNVQVLKRYSIENYIFDPLITAVSFIRLGRANLLDTVKHLNASQVDDFLSDATLVQNAVDEVCEILESVSLEDLTESRNKVAVKILHGRGEALEYTIPEWFIKTKKDQLKPSIIRQPSSISSYINDKENLIAMEASGIVFQDIKDIFQALQ